MLSCNQLEAWCACSAARPALSNGNNYKNDNHRCNILSSNGIHCKILTIIIIITIIALIINIIISIKAPNPEHSETAHPNAASATGSPIVAQSLIQPNQRKTLPSNYKALGHVLGVFFIGLYP